MLARLSVNLHGDRSEHIKNTLVIKFREGTEPRQYRDVGSGLMCVNVNHIDKTAGFTNWSGKIHTFPLQSILGVFSHDEYQTHGGTSDAIADLFE